MDLSIAIVNWNTSDILDQCLMSIYDTVKGLEYEVIVVDNNSSDGSVQMVREKHLWVKLLANNENVGFSRANNQAYKISQGRYFLLLNSDTVCRPSALSGMVAFLDAHPSAGVVGPLVLNADKTLQPSWARFPSVWSEIIGRLNRNIDGVSEPPRDAMSVRKLGHFQTDWVGGCCLMLRRDSIENVGLMDESLYMYCEETDWCYRLRQNGWEVWVDPRYEIVHLGGASSAQMPDQTRRVLIESKVKYFRKHHGELHARMVGAVLGIKGRIKSYMRQGCAGC